MNFGSGLILLAIVFTAEATELKQDTVKVWQEYVGSATAAMRERLRPGVHFLKIDEDRNWASKIRGGEILVFRGGSQSEIKVPSGLIHDWFGAGFVPRTTLNQVLSVLRDYDSYREFYCPTVVDSATLSTDGLKDRFSITIVNKSSFVETAFASDYKCLNVPVSDRRWYSISESTRIQEIVNYGRPSQHMLRDGQGNGLLWRVFSISRFEERDGGVYIEIEAIALSRDIPVSLRWLIEPIVRRVSQKSLITSLRQTEGAVRAAATRADSGGISMAYSRHDKLLSERSR
ncbi:MAG: hypothetical protein JO091_10545 [Acidobacteriaceae bacterium]|nr:hypothetical protein [Acidobacteriaceae bacterium]